MESRIFTKFNKKYKIILHPAYVKIDNAFVSLKEKGDKLELVRYTINDNYDDLAQFFLIPVDKRLWPDYLLNKDGSEVTFV